MIWLYALIGLLVGFALAFLFLRTRQMGNQLSEIATLQGQIREREESIDGLRETHLADARTLATREEQIKQLENRLEEQARQFEASKEDLAREFQLLANKILEDNSKKFTAQNKEGIDAVLTPLREKIKDFESKVEQNHRNETEDRAKLKIELENLLKLNQRLSEDAQNLANALKGENKTQGNWGEMILQKILESSGLQRGVEYLTQASYTDHEGRRVQPDVVIKLPEEKHIIIDSKVSLTAYERMVNADNEEERSQFLQAHIQSVKSHIKGLSEKSYEAIEGLSTPDFVLLFMPVESSFAMAIANDQDLYNYAWERKVVIVTPSTLLATLRTISSVWKQENQHRNVLEIARLAGTLYDKFVSFSQDMDQIENRLNQASSAYQSARNKLVDGRGNMVQTALKTKELGVKSKKEFGDQWLSRKQDDQESLNSAE